MKRLFFILLSVFVINLEVYGEGCQKFANVNISEDNTIEPNELLNLDKNIYIYKDENKIISIKTINCNTENKIKNKDFCLDENDFDISTYKPCIELLKKINMNIKYNVNINNDSSPKSVTFKYNYTCANGYTNQYYATANDTYKQEQPLPQKSTYDKGCFKYVRYCSDLTKPKNCGITGITETLTDKQIYQQGDKHILLVQDTNLTVKNLKWCDSDGVGSNVKCGTGGVIQPANSLVKTIVRKITV